MSKLDVTILGSVIAKRLIHNKSFNDSFNVVEELLWESPLSRKSYHHEFKNNNSILLVDLYAMSYSLFSDDNGKIYTNNTKLKEGELFNSVFAKKTPISFGQILQLDWKKMLRKYIDNILRCFPSDKIVLIKSEKSGYETTPFHCRATKNNVREFNQNMEIIENFFVSETDCYVVDLCKYYFGCYENNVANVNMNYEEEFFTDITTAVKRIYSEKFETKVYDIPDFGFVLDRYARFYNHMLRSNLQGVLLNNSDIADHIVLAMGKEQIIKHKDNLAKIKANKYTTLDELFNKFSFTQCNDLKCIIRCIEAIDKGNYAIPNFDYSVIFKENMRLRILMIPRIKARLQQEQILSNVEVTVDNIEICFTYLNLFLSKQYRKAVEYVLANADKLQTPIMVDIWGSCISREIYNLNSGVIKLDKYLYRSSCIHAFSEPVEVDVSMFDNAEQFSGGWRRDVVRSEFMREASTQLENSNAEWIVMDLFDLVEECYALNGKPFILDAFGRNSPFFRKMKKDCVDFFWYEQPDEIVQERMDALIKFLTKRYGNNIILNRHLRTGYRININNEIIPFDSYAQELRNSHNQFIRKWEQYFIDKTACYRIDIAKDFLGDEMFVWSASPVHYEDEFFSQSIRIIEEIIINKPTQKEFNEYPYSVKLDRILRLLPKNHGKVIMERLFGETYLDRIVLNLDCNVISKYKAVLEKIHLCNYADMEEMLLRFDFGIYDAVELKEQIFNNCDMRI